MPALFTPKQLREAVNAANTAAAPHRALRLDNYRELKGRFYPSANPEDIPRHMNMVHRFVSVMVPHLVMRNPEHEVRPLRKALSGEAAMLRLVLDHRAERSNRRALSRACIMDALLGSKAIIKHGLKVNEDLVKIQGRDYCPGEPYTRRISYDDYICDPSARGRDEMLFEGDYYRISRAAALESGIFNPAVVERIPSLGEGAGRDNRQERHADDRGDSLGSEERYGLLDRIELIDVSVYDENTTYIVTMAAEEVGPDDEFLRVREWQGYKTSPYITLEFQPLNDHTEGLPPVSVIREQADAFYAIVNKLVSQAKDGKRLLLAGKDAPEDEIEEIREAADHSIVRVTDPRNYVNADLGGVVDQLIEMAQLLQGWFNVQANNPDMLGGTGANTDKATIFSGLQANAATIIDDLADTHDRFQTELSNADAFYALEDPFMVLPLEYRMPGAESVEVVYDARQRQGAYQDFQFKVRARSTGRVDPAVRGQRLQALIETIFRAAEVSAATGGYINVPGVAKVAAAEAEVRELEEIVNDPTVTMELDAILGAVPPRGTAGVAGITPGMNPQQAQGGRVAPANQQAKTPIGAVRSAITQGQPRAPRLAS